MGSQLCDVQGKPRLSGPCHRVKIWVIYGDRWKNNRLMLFNSN